MTAEMKSVLFIRRDNIGDLVCTTPAIRAVRLRYPGIRVGVLANTYNSGAVVNNPDVDEIFVYEKEKHAGGKGRVRVFLDNFSVMRKIRGIRYDAAVGCSYGYSERVARLAYLTGARVRAGFAPGGDAAGNAFYNLTVPAPSKDEPLHEVEAMMSLVRALGVEGPAPPLFIRPVDDEVRRTLGELERVGFRKGMKTAAIHISTRRPENMWPRERFLELSDRIQAASGMQVLLLWSPGSADNAMHPGDDEAAEWILKNSRIRPFALRTENLSGLIAAQNLADTAICLDGGAMHIAAALGKPVLAIWGSTDKRRWAPWGVPNIILQDRDGPASSIGAAEAFDAFQRLCTGKVLL